jgi:hypothetical protein
VTRRTELDPADFGAAFGAILAKDGRGTMYGPKNGELRGTHSVLEAARMAERNGWAFYVRVRRDILALDCDDPFKSARGRKIAATMREAGLNPVIVKSGGKGERIHVFARIADPVLRTRFEKKAKALGLDVRQAIRPPMSPHRLGGRSILVEPADPHQALAALALATRPPGQLRGKLRNLAFNGDPDYPSRAAAATVLGLAVRHWSRETIWSFLMEPGHKSGDTLRDIRDHHERERVFDRLYQSALAKIAASPTRRRHPGIDAKLARIRTRLDADPACWRGRRGAAFYVTARILMAIARRCGSLKIHPGCRYLAEELGVNCVTANMYCNELRRRRVLKLLHKGGGRWPTTWKIRLRSDALGSQHPRSSPLSDKSSDLHLSAPTGRRMGKACTAACGTGVAVRQYAPCLDDFVAADVFAPSGWLGAHGLGFQAWHALVILEETEGIVSPAVLTWRLGSSVGKVLRKLLRLRLVRRVGRGFVRGDASLIEAAQELGTLGARTWRRAHHLADRARYRKQLEAGARGTQPAPGPGATVRTARRNGS